MDSTTHSFINPTTCFTVACVAFSLLAVSTIWLNHSSSNPSKRDKTTTPTRPQPQRRLAVDSLYVETREDSDQDSLAPSKQQQLSGVISLGAKVAQLLQIYRDTVAVHLLSEVSLTTNILCRLQQIVLSNPAEFSNGATGLSACFDAVISALQVTFISLEAALRRGEPSLVMNDALQQLRDQRPVLDFLLHSTHEENLPPTPPAESPTKEFAGHLAPPASFDLHTGITPGVDEKCWIEPPPEYSPPAGSAAPVLSEKSEKASASHDRSSSPERDDAPNDSDALYEYVTSNDTLGLSESLTDGADPSLHSGELSRTALHQAAHLNHVDCIAILLRHGAVMNTEDAKGDTALHLAAWAGNVEAISTLLAHGADLDWLSGRDAYSPLWCAVTAQQIDAARLLLRHGARLSLRSGGGLMPLHQAAVTGQHAMCELLLDRGANTDCLDDDKNTPLHYAAASGSVSTVQALLRSGADIEAGQIHGLTAAHWASHKGHVEVLTVLLDYGARLDRETEEGATPLHLAANRGHVAAARLLLDRGAVKNAAVATWDGVTGTPSSMAKAKGHARLARILKA